MGPDVSAGIQDEETFALQQRLFDARETRYRVQKDKYLLTMRNMHILDHCLETVMRFFEAARHSLAFERERLTLHTAQLTGDCMQVRDTLTYAKATIRERIKRPLDRYKSLLESRGKQALDELLFSVDQLLDAANQYRDNPKNIGDAIGDIILKFFNSTSVVFRGDELTDLTWNEYVDLVLEDRNITVWTLYTTLVATLHLLEEEEHYKINTGIRNVSVVEELRLEKSRLDPLVKYIGTECVWCSDSSSNPLVEIVKSRVLKYTGETLYMHVHNARLILQYAVDTYLVDLLKEENLKTITGWADPEFYVLVNASQTELKSATELASSALKDAEEAEEFIENLLTYTWGLQCQTELKNMAKRYEGGNIFANDILNNTLEYLYEEHQKLKKLWAKYVSESATLEDVAYSITTSDIQDVIENRQLRLDTVLNDRWLSVHDMHNQILTIGYTFLTVIDDRHLANTSAYWQEFEMTSAGTSADYSVNDNPLLLPDFYMIPSQQEMETWKGMLHNIEVMRENLYTQSVALSSNITTSQEYFRDYIRGNQISPDFYA